MNSYRFYLAIALLALSAVPLSAQRRAAPVKNGPGAPPGQVFKVTRVDFEKRQNENQERKDKIESLLLDESLADDELMKEAKRIEREALEAQARKLQEAEELARKNNPEDFAKDPGKVPLTAAPREASIHEAVVTRVDIVEKAQAVVVRRAR
jgi:hypothetical protein